MFGVALAHRLVEKGDAMKVTYDAEADCAYIELTTIEAGGVAHTIPIQIAPAGVLGQVNLDIGPDGRLVGIEIVGVAQVLPTGVQLREA